MFLASILSRFGGLRTAICGAGGHETRLRNLFSTVRSEPLSRRPPIDRQRFSRACGDIWAIRRVSVWTAWQGETASCEVDCSFWANFPTLLIVSLVTVESGPSPDGNQKRLSRRYCLEDQSPESSVCGLRFSSASCGTSLISKAEFERRVEWLGVARCRRGRFARLW